MEMGFSLSNNNKELMQMLKRDLVIIGGGLAGLSLSILLARKKFNITVIEKGSYPKHKVCGEYISMESYAFLENLGLDLKKNDFPHISELVLTSQDGKVAKTKIAQKGGIGISRYFLDEALSKLAQQEGVEILSDCKATDIVKVDKTFEIKTNQSQHLTAKLVVGAYGRLSNFITNNNGTVRKNTFVGIKYHVNQGPADSIIEMHQFEGGYCGISKVEKDAYCLCYLVKSDLLRLNNNNIEELEKQVLAKNKLLKKRLAAKRLTPVVVTSNFNFSIPPTNNDWITIGDASGFIPPIAGNGMSLAFRSANELVAPITDYLHEKISYRQLVKQQQFYVNRYLKKRIKKGVFLQHLLLTKNKLLRLSLITILGITPRLFHFLSKQAIGKEIITEL